MKHLYWVLISLLTVSVAYAQRCPPLVTPTIKITQVGSLNKRASASFCQGDQVQLNAITGTASVSAVAYQWQRDGVDINGATRPTLVVNQSGAYTISLRQQGVCPDTTLSAATTISANQCGSGGLLPIIGGQLEDFNGNAEELSALLLRAAYFTSAKSFDNFPPSIKAYVYRKKDSSSVATVTMVRGSAIDGQNTPLPAACNGDSSRINSVVYFGSVNFLPSVNDPKGYFVTTEPVCCREVSNNVNGTGPVVYYLEFGDRSKYNVSALKSSFGGIFNVPSRIETCVNQPVRIDTRAYAGVNFDKITYSLTTPLTGNATTPRKEVNWANGYGANAFMESSSPLQVNPKGEITGTPTKVGTYRYVVKAELYQDSFKGFEIRRELALQVKECPAVITPKVIVSAVDKPAELVKSVICQDGAVQLNAKTPLQDVDYQWYKDNVAIEGATDSVLVARQAGRYTVTVTKEMACPRSATSAPVSVSISPNPTVNLTVNNAAGALCNGNSFTITATSSATATGTLFRWQRDTSVIASEIGSFYKTNLAGVYSVTVTDANGCTGHSTPLPVTLNEPPEASILTTATGFCPGNSLRLQANTGNGLTYQWQRNGTPIGGATSATYEAGTAGLYSVLVGNVNSCTTLSGLKTISASTVPTVKLSGPTQLCRGLNVRLTAIASESSLQYTWLQNETVITGAQATTLAAKSGGIYQVQVTNANGCSAVSANWSLTEVDKPTVSLDSILPFCGTDNAPVLLTGTPAGGIFSGNGVSGNQFWPEQAGIGAHEVTYTVTGNTACPVITAQRTVLVRALPALDLPTDLTIQPGASASLPGPVNTNYRYSWSPSAGLDNASIARPTAFPASSTLYTLTVRDQFGCQSADSMMVYVESRLYIPDAFTPNGDGNNDVWVLRNIEKIKNVEVTVFNRWGTVVFHSIGYETPFDGKDLPNGAYAYEINYGEPRKRLTGTVMILR